MTTTTSVAPAPSADTDETAAALRARADRGLELYEARGHEIVRTAPFRYLVPGSRGRSYAVDYKAETCDCPDFEHRAGEAGIPCKHLYAVGISRAARRSGAAAHLAALEDRAAHEDMDPDERGELLERIRRGHRFLAPVGA